MGSYKIRIVVTDAEDANLYTTKTAYVESDDISSFYIEDVELVDGEEVKPYFVACGITYYSVMPDAHVYKMLFDKFIKNAIKK